MLCPFSLKSITDLVASIRTLSGNTNNGTDHGWSGHSFIVGGRVDGGKIHGQYPKDLSKRGNPLHIGRGRLIPEMPWEAQWNAVAQWAGVETVAGLNSVLPNRGSFPNGLLANSTVFLVDLPGPTACDGEGEPISCNPYRTTTTSAPT